MKRRQRRLLYFAAPIPLSLLATLAIHNFIVRTNSNQNFNELPVFGNQIFSRASQQQATLLQHRDEKFVEKQPPVSYSQTFSNNRTTAASNQGCPVTIKADRGEQIVGGLAAMEEARDENGCSGYIHDTTYVRQNPLNFTFFPGAEGICDKRWGLGPEGRRGIKGLNKMRIADTESTPSVLCMVYTHSNRHHILRSIVETYGQRCDGFLAVSNQTDKSLGAVHIPHMGNESYGSIWPKVRSTWKYVHFHYLNMYSWFHIGGDDMFVVAENLKNAVKQYPIDEEPIYLGGAMIRLPKGSERMCGGGAGYTLNRAALKVLVEQQFPMPYCKTDDIRPDEDVMVSDCFRPVGISCTHSTDELDETRYHPLSAQYHAIWKFPGPANWYPDKLKKRHGITSAMKPYLESISATTVSFHLVLQTKLGFNAPETVFVDKGMRRYHAILFNLCEKKTHPQQKRKQQKARLQRQKKRKRLKL